MRGNADGPSVDLLGMVMTGGIATIVGVVVLTVFSEVSSEQFQAEAESIETVCAGFYGCGGPGIVDLLGPLVLILIGVLIINVVRRSGRANSDNSRDVVSIKKQYVDEDGDIDTILELEAELDDAIDAKDLWDNL